MPAAADPDVGAVYTAEDRLARWFGLGTVTVFGTRWALEPEVVFARVPDVQRYVDRVLTHLATQSWREPSGAALTPVAVRARRGARKAHYDQARHTIAIPPAERGGAWALRESVVLHELAHHLCAVHASSPASRTTPVPDTCVTTRAPSTSCASRTPHTAGTSSASGRNHAPAEPPHGPHFRRTLLALLTEAGHPTAAALLRIAFADEGLA